MKILKYIAFFLLAVLVTTSCRQVKEVERIKYVTKDSIRTKDSIVDRERIVYTPVDSAKIKALVVCPDGKPVNFKPTSTKSKHASAFFEIKDGVATVNCFCDSVGVKVRERERYRTEFKQHLNEVLEKSLTTQQVKYVPVYIQVFAWIGLGAVLLVIYKLINYFK